VTAEQLDELIREGALERVPRDGAAAGRDLAAARAHLQSLEPVSATDPIGAFALAYEAIRKAIVAHMRANGLRVRASRGGHYQTGRYALAALESLGVTEHLLVFEDLRRLRNKSAYEAVLVEDVDVAEAVAHARAIVAAVEADLS